VSKVTKALIPPAAACAKAVASLFSSAGRIASFSRRPASEWAIANCVEVNGIGANPRVWPISRRAFPAAKSPLEKANANSASDSGGTNRRQRPDFAKSNSFMTVACPSAMAKRIFVSTARWGVCGFTVNHLHGEIELTFILLRSHFRCLCAHRPASSDRFCDLWVALIILTGWRFLLHTSILLVR
jgi:hypothetical protein